MLDLDELNKLNAVDSESADDYDELRKKEEEFKERLLGMSNKELGELLLTKSLMQLLITVETGMATAADINAARQFLKDNDIGIVPTRENVAGKLKEKLNMRAAQAHSFNKFSAEDLEEMDINDFTQQ